MLVIAQDRAIQPRTPATKLGNGGTLDNHTEPSLMQTLIPDGLLQVFAHCIKVDLSRSMTTIQILAAVCKHWRDVALSNPLLWAKVMVLGVSERSAAVLDVCLERSKEVPLTMSLGLNNDSISQGHFERGSEAGESSLFERVFGLMIAQQKRWKSFTMICNVVSDFPEREWVLNDIPIVENLFLRTPIGRHHGQPTFCLDLSNSPRLKTLGLHGDIRLCNARSYLLSHLTNLQLDHTDHSQLFPSISDCLALLSKAPNIDHIRVYPSCPENSIQAEYPHLKLPNLRKMEIGAHGKRSVIGILLAQLTLPALCDLRIINDVCKRWRDESTQSRTLPYGLPAFIERSRPPLVSLTVDSIIEHEPYLIEALRCMSDLKKLVIPSCCTLSYRILEALTLSLQPGSKQPCAELESIDFGECAFGKSWNDDIPRDPQVIDAAVGMIVSRWNCVSPMRPLRLVRAKYSILNELQKNPLIGRCVAEGLSLLCEEQELD